MRAPVEAPPTAPRGLIACDLDDTLIPRSQGVVRREDLEAIRAVQGAGLVFAPVTGRTYADTARMMAGAADCYGTGAYVNAQQVYVEGELVVETLVDPAVLDGIAAHLARHWRANLLVYGREDGLGHRVGRSSAGGGEWMTRENRRAVDTVARASEVDPIKANIQCDLDDDAMAELTSDIQGRFPEVSVVRPGDGVPELDVMPVGWSKARGLVQLCDALSIPLDRVVAFGDSDSDLPMLEAAGSSFAVANGVPAARAVADEVLPEATTGSVPRKLEEIARCQGTIDPAG